MLMVTVSCLFLNTDCAKLVLGIMALLCQKGFVCYASEFAEEASSGVVLFLFVSFLEGKKKKKKFAAFYMLYHSISMINHASYVH